MLPILDRPARLCDGVTRREWLRLGSASLLGLSAVGRARAADRASACIVLFLAGGPPQHETWDPKPGAPAEIRGPFQPIPSATTGLHVGELMPRLAGLTGRLAVLRAVSTDDNAHSASGYYVFTGHPHAPRNTESVPPGPPNDAPGLGGVVRKLAQRPGRLPAAVTLPEGVINNPNNPWPGQDAGYLGRSADPWRLVCDPSAPGFRLPELTAPGDLPPLRVDGRAALLTDLDRYAAGVERSGAAARFDAARAQAFDLVRSPAARAAFDLDREPPRVRDRYGRHKFGQSVLLARRLVEAGVTLVQVNWPRESGDTTSNAPLWDTHAKNAERLKTALMPPWDQAFSALLEDLTDRGMLGETLVVCVGEFGRTPRHNPAGGRDHWGHVFSAALAGGGVRGGAVYGASDSRGAYPQEGRVQPEDLTATVFHCLGFDPHTEVHDVQGRPQPISRGRVIREILS